MHKKTGKEETVTLKKSTLLGILHLLALSAFSVDIKANAIWLDADIGENKEHQGPAFTHEQNYKGIKKTVEDLYKVNKVVMDAIPADDVSVSECVDYVIRSAKFKKLLKDYGADLKDNFEKI